MITAISAQDKELTSPVECHFGRCCFFFIFDDETERIEVVENCDRESKSCAGESILHCLIDKGIGHIISANFGNKVQSEMVRNNIRMTLLTDCSKTVGDVIQLIRRKQHHLEL